MITKELTVLVYDFGYYLPIAQKLTEFYKKVYYYVPEINAGYPTHAQHYVGQNIEGIEVVDSWAQVYELVDLFVFPDVYDRGLQELLRRLGKKVFGCGNAGELEVDRVALKEVLEDLKLDVANYKVVKGLDELKSYLKKRDDLWIKSSLRGNMETWHHTTWELSKKEIDKLQAKLGASANQEEYLIESPITDATEYGCDLMVVGGEYAKMGTVGIEIKGLCYACAMVSIETFPDGLKIINEKFSKVLAEHRYMGALSNEVRVTKDGKNYLGDLTTRFGSPPFSIWLEMIENFGEVVYLVASGVVPEIKIKHKFGVQVSILSATAKNTALPIIIPKKNQPFVKIINAMVDENDTLCYIPQREESDDVLVGNVIGLGDTLEAAIEHCKKNAESVQGFDIEIPVKKLDSATDEINNLKKFGITIWE